LREGQNQDGSDFFIGARLAARRQKVGIPIEKAAKDTRIPASRLRAIEADDFSSFSHPTYARLFLTDYANYLGIPIEDIREYLPGVKGLGSSENSYLDVLLKKPGFLQGDQFKSIRRLLIALGVFVGLLILAGAGIYSWRAWKKIERVKSAPVVSTDNEAPAATPTPTPTPTPGPSPTPEPPPSEMRPSVQTSDAIRIQPPLVPAAPPVSKRPAAPVADPTPLTSLPPFEPAPRTKRNE
jgi:cytoskeletal protein RodZ